MTRLTMLQLKHTPGPWITDGRWVARSFSPNQPFIADCHVSQDHREGGVENTKANAQLIAASPDLLEACKAAHQMFCDAVFIWGKDDDKKVGHMTKAIALAIKKAEGAM